MKMAKERKDQRQTYAGLQDIKVVAVGIVVLLFIWSLFIITIIAFFLSRQQKP